ncbi:hypothetical protein ACTXT7_007313 [Hymenolepis weldensis]
MSRTKREFRKKGITQKVKPMVSQMTEPIASSKKDMKQNENPRKNPHECVAKTNTKRGEKRKQHPELVPKSNAIKKTDNENLLSKSKTKTVLLFRHPKRTPQAKRKENDRSYGKWREPCEEKLTRELLSGCSSKT